MVEEQLEVALSADIESGAQKEAEPSGPPPQYWLRVHGYPSDLSSEVVSYDDFGDLFRGRLSDDPPALLQPGDVLIYYADGPASLYGLATVSERVTGPERGSDGRRRWTVPVKRESIIKAVNKAPHAAGLRPPSGRHFLTMVRDYTYIRLPEEDGVYLVAQVKSRAGSKD